MDEEVLYELGVDLNSSLDFTNGDLNLASYKDNLVQGVMNRLNTDLNELDLFYEDYGSSLNRFFGWKATDETLGFMEAEIENVLDNDPRLTGVSAECSYTGDGMVRIDLELYPIVGVEVDVNMVLTNNGVVEIETDEINTDEIEEEI